jgi:hypothetical protein
MEGNPHLAKQHLAMRRRMTALAEEVRGLRREYSENFALLESLTMRLERQRRGIREDARSHIRHMAIPAPSTRRRFDRLGEAWAAVSLSLLLFAIVALLFLAPGYVGAGLAVTTILFVVIESIMRRAFIQTVSELTALLAIIACVILVIHFWYWLLVGVLIAVASFLLLQRVRELAG